MKDLEVQLTEQEESANSAILKWQESCKALEESNAELIQSLEASAGPNDEQATTDQHDTVAALQRDLEQAKEALAAAEAKLADDDDVVVKWEGKHSMCLFFIEDISN